ncbi:hypothetical protein [Rickettsiales endosymbiont of Stachyamoeba lipophora]|uniref:hypothetical protein n=1 Tax=Rickettsiales endosymbiont of Stachyamoeba lipophora TaxID=2486578 RepID=UPI000F64F70D|nr:hypothetical protein [Rickettsiales endosymbiont of Stachyamoeba lipophora]AZL15255.1 hypothetical protein EF513_01605 [Rickettsiales endosymbiont of Stachyamoeba lipophora]
MTIANLAKQYNAFQHKVGKSLDDSFKQEIPILFAENFKKLVNGVELVSDRSAISKQLADVKLIAGCWVVELKEHLPCIDNIHCTLRYYLITKNLGSFDVIAILKSHDGNLLDEVNEIYYQMDMDVDNIEHHTSN